MRLKNIYLKFLKADDVAVGGSKRFALSTFSPADVCFSWRFNERRQSSFMVIKVD